MGGVSGVGGFDGQFRPKRAATGSVATLNRSTNRNPPSEKSARLYMMIVGSRQKPNQEISTARRHRITKRRAVRTDDVLRDPFMPTEATVEGSYSCQLEWE